ncbi:MAG TPA: hypothetical protein VNT75_26050 [Symbiobacteriaceae bacterium]|nr:hypothetical protein [Symbiobacteriaceae bacterium]
MFNVVGQMLAARGGLPIVGPLVRMVSPCQIIPAPALEQIIMASPGPILAPLTAVPGVMATVERVMVTCPQGGVQINIRLDVRPGEIGFTGQLRWFGMLEPVALPIAMGLPNPTLCLRANFLQYDLQNLPEEIQRQIVIATQTYFRGLTCLPPNPVVRQAL